jgi:hypothetical protein
MLLGIIDTGFDGVRGNRQKRGDLFVRELFIKNEPEDLLMFE